jgi:hypothetical protein
MERKHKNEEEIMNNEKYSYRIEVSNENDFCEEFVEWLNAKGHDASVCKNDCGSIEGYSNLFSHEYSEIMNELWEAYCNNG